MKIFTCSGGVHPPEFKSAAAFPIEILPLPERVIIPLVQHAGTPATVMVKPGDMVRTGEKIGESAGFISANVHSSVTGKVIAVGPHAHPAGMDALSVEIEVDEKEQWADGTNQKQDWSGLGNLEMRDLILDAGIVGMGGAAFPTHVKLLPPAGKRVDTLMINGVECEPYLTADHRLMLERTDDILTGVRILQKIFQAKQVFVAVEQNKMDAFSALSRAMAGMADMECVAVKTKYPQGGEKQLIHAVTGREVPSGGLPVDCGCAVFNVGTALAVMEAVCLRKPLIERVLTVAGPGVADPKNLKVRMGCSFRQAIDACGGMSETCTTVVAGGPMMGVAQWSLDVPVVKATSGILCLTGKNIETLAARPCISCGACMRACSMRLVPARIVQNVGARNWEQAEKLGALDCTACGSCAYVCPSKINLVHYLKWGKSEIECRKKGMLK